jgi:hypothetical protein
MERPDPEDRSPQAADRQTEPVPERPTTPLEEEEMDLAQLDDPPQAEGDRGTDP